MNTNRVVLVSIHTAIQLPPVAAANVGSSADPYARRQNGGSSAGIKVNLDPYARRQNGGSSADTKVNLDPYARRHNGGSSAGIKVNLDLYARRKVSRVMDTSEKRTENFSPIFGLGEAPETVRMHVIQTP